MFLDGDWHAFDACHSCPNIITLVLSLLGCYKFPKTHIMKLGLMKEWNKTLHESWCLYDGNDLDYGLLIYSTVYSNMWCTRPDVETPPSQRISGRGDEDDNEDTEFGDAVQPLFIAIRPLSCCPEHTHTECFLEQGHIQTACKCRLGLQSRSYHPDAPRPINCRPSVYRL
jgi:hypothetical protein